MNVLHSDIISMIADRIAEDYAQAAIPPRIDFDEKYRPDWVSMSFCRQALHSMTLVCRMWREAAEPALYRFIHMNHDNQLDPYNQPRPLVRIKNQTSRPLLSEYYDSWPMHDRFLRTIIQHPPKAKHVRYIHLQGICPMFYNDESLHGLKDALKAFGLERTCRRRIRRLERWYITTAVLLCSSRFVKYLFVHLNYEFMDRLLKIIKIAQKHIRSFEVLGQLRELRLYEDRRHEDHMLFNGQMIPLIWTSNGPRTLRWLNLDPIKSGLSSLRHIIIRDGRFVAEDIAALYRSHPALCSVVDSRELHVKQLECILTSCPLLTSLSVLVALPRKPRGADLERVGNLLRMYGVRLRHLALEGDLRALGHVGNLTTLTALERLKIPIRALLPTQYKDFAGPIGCFNPNPSNFESIDGLIPANLSQLDCIGSGADFQRFDSEGEFQACRSDLFYRQITEIMKNDRRAHLEEIEFETESEFPLPRDMQRRWRRLHKCFEMYGWTRYDDGGSVIQPRDFKSIRLRRGIHQSERQL